MKTSLSSILLSIIVLLAIQMPVGALPSATASSGPLSVTMTLASAKTIVPGQPIVVRYSITNTSASASAHFDIGQNNTGWYRLSLSDAKGQPAQVIPDLRPLAPTTEGLYQTGDRTLASGDSLEGALVVTHYFQVTRPGEYELGVHVVMDYKAEEKFQNATGEDEPPILFHLDQNFNIPIEVLSPNSAAVRATAEALRRKLVRLDVPTADQWEPVAEELFSMPEAQALSTWQALTNDPATPDKALIEAAHQLAYHPTRAAANLLTQMDWNPARSSADGGLQPEGIVAQSEITKAVSHLNRAADASLKQYLRSLFLMNGTPASEIRFHD